MTGTFRYDGQLIRALVGSFYRVFRDFEADLPKLDLRFHESHSFRDDVQRDVAVSQISPNLIDRRRIDSINLNG
jgi:hypothetical protein